MSMRVEIVVEIEFLSLFYFKNDVTFKIIIEFKIIISKFGSIIILKVILPKFKNYVTFKIIIRF